MTDDKDWTTSDAERVLGLGLSRTWSVRTYGLAGAIGHTFSNGTEADIAFDAAADLMRMSPFVRLVMEAGIRALRDTEPLEGYVMRLYAGGVDETVAMEAALRNSMTWPEPYDPVAAAREVDEIVEQMTAHLIESLEPTDA